MQAINCNQMPFSQYGSLERLSAAGEGWERGAGIGVARHSW
jgi:hypothetical protein